MPWTSTWTGQGFLSDLQNEQNTIVADLMTELDVLVWKIFMFGKAGVVVRVNEECKKIEKSQVQTQ